MEKISEILENSPKLLKKYSIFEKIKQNGEKKVLQKISKTIKKFWRILQNFWKNLQYSKKKQNIEKKKMDKISETHQNYTKNKRSECFFFAKKRLRTLIFCNFGEF